MNLTASAVSALRPVICVLIGSLGIQTSSVICSTLFGQLGTVAVSTLRLAIAAVFLFVIFRPRLTKLTRERWMNAVIYGIAMAAMNQFLFAAIDRLPLGVAVTLDFLGPCLVSFFGLKYWRGRMWALAAFAGVVLIAGPSSGLDPLGIVFGLLAGTFFAAYTVFAERVGKTEGGLGDLAVSVSVAAVLTFPLAAPSLGNVDTRAWLILTVAAVVGVVIPYIADTMAAKYSSAQVVGTLFALDPVLGSLLGWLFAGDQLTARIIIGIAVVTVAGAAITWQSAPGKETKPEPF
nr:Inner membrane transporter rhtA [Streptococcus thermophilus]